MILLHVIIGIGIGIVFQTVSIMLLANGDYVNISNRRKIAMALAGGCSSALIIMLTLSVLNIDEADVTHQIRFRIYTLGGVGGWAGATLVDKITTRLTREVIDDDSSDKSDS